MVEQVFRVAAVAVHQHEESANSIALFKTDHCDRLQPHPRPSAGDFLGDHFENVSIKVCFPNSLDAVLVAPCAQIKERPFSLMFAQSTWI